MILFERYSYLRRNFRGHKFWARGYYVNTVGLNEAMIRQYIKTQQDRESVESRYDTDLVQDLFSGANSIMEYEQEPND